MRRESTRESGVTLIYALGMLAIIMGLAGILISKALSARAVLYGTCSISEARNRAISVTDRVMSMIVAVDPDAAAVRNVCSMSDPAARPEDKASARYFEFLRPYKPYDRSLLDVGDGIGYSGDSSQAQWVYEYGKARNSEGSKIIVGRYAYQLMPAGRITYFRTLAGSKPITSQATFLPKAKYDGHPDHETDRFEVASWRHRWGQDIDELNLDLAGTPFEGWMEKTAGWATMPAVLQVLYEQAGALDMLKEKKDRAWFEDWFSDGTVRSLQEIGPDNRCRFNLTAYPGDNPWYERFGASPNSPSVIDMLSSVPPEVDAYDVNDGSPQKKWGIPFLRFIGSEPKSFDSLENRRKQIIANFNDYCDGDDTPTSDVAASSWTPSGNKPSYTGNERTLYLNEFATAVEFGAFRNFDTDNAISYNLDVALLLELVDMYGGISSSGYQARMKCDSIDVPVSLLLSDIKVEYTYTTTDAEGNSSTVTATKDIASKTIELMLNCTPGDISVDTFRDVGPYKFGATTDPLNVTGTVDAVTKDDIGGPCDSIDKVEIGGCRATAGTIVLKSFGSIVLSSAGGNVDFARMPSELNAAGSVFFDISGGFKEKKSGLSFLDCEVHDPRQNLNGENACDTAGISDWKWQGGVMPSMDFGALPESDILQHIRENGVGRINETCRLRTIGDEVDSEPEDPAWNGDETGQHMSTAVIRNAPMQSPWEIGFIGRGAAFQTINLKYAGGLSEGTDISEEDQRKVAGSDGYGNPGTSYKDGDGAILDWTKTTYSARCYGKIGLRKFAKDENRKVKYDGETVDLADGLDEMLLQMLFNKVSVSQDAKTFIDESKLDGASGTEATGTVSNARGAGSEFYKELNKLEAEKIILRSQVLNLGSDDKCYWNAFGCAGEQRYDAQRESVVGRTINLLDAIVQPTGLYQAVVVYQTIVDKGGKIAVRIKDSDKWTVKYVDAELGKFDAYWDWDEADIQRPYDTPRIDVITSETKLLVTFEVDAGTGKKIVRKIRFLD
ncbi:MAG: hypothetical protein MJ025_05745 [Victivallaceae bacterium]|nr:hypothetical protein [Victivallaceae bacterium]